MSTVVKDINDSIESTVSTVLGVDYKELDYKLEIERNDFRNVSKRYGVVPLGGNQVEGALKAYTVDQLFELTLTHDFINRDDDVDTRDKSFLLFEKTHAILKEVIQTKAGIPTKVLNIEGFDIADPEYIEPDNVVVQRTRINVTYRNALTV